MTQARFAVPEEAARPDACAVGVTETQSLLALQETEHESVRDRQARRHGNALLDVLARLQHALLGPAGQAGHQALESLAALLRATPVADDPHLAAVQRAVLVRAAVELARRRTAAPK